MSKWLLTVLALLAFAGNSVLCRVALGGSLIDASGFTALRLLAGALTLLLLCWVSQKQGPALRDLFKPGIRHTQGAVLLFVYALSFSFAYMILDTGPGALILFGAVQLTLLAVSLFAGKRLIILEWLGVLLSFLGLIYLLLPTWGTPSFLGFILMALSGLAWGLYTVAGQGSKNALLETTKNFIWSVPLLVVLSLFSFQPNLWTTVGVFLAILSGALTSGIGYAIWYSVLPQLSTSQAGVLQLLVPILAAIGGVVFASEDLTLRLIVASFLVLSGIYLVIIGSRKSLKS